MSGRGGTTVLNAFFAVLVVDFSFYWITENIVRLRNENESVFNIDSFFEGFLSVLKLIFCKMFLIILPLRISSLLERQ